jgi:hypothetical protein
MRVRAVGWRAAVVYVRKSTDFQTDILPSYINRIGEQAISKINTSILNTMRSSKYTISYTIASVLHVRNKLIRFYTQYVHSNLSRSSDNIHLIWSLSSALPVTSPIALRTVGAPLIAGGDSTPQKVSSWWRRVGRVHQPKKHQYPRWKFERTASAVHPPPF